MVTGNYIVYKPHECERECPDAPCRECGEYLDRDCIDIDNLGEPEEEDHD